MIKTVPVSIRLTQSDAEFIASLQMNDALTLSDKIRSIIKETRKQKEKVEDYQSYLLLAKDKLKTASQLIKIYEREGSHYSLLVNLFQDWMTETFAFLAAFGNPSLTEKVDMQPLEAGIATRVFRLFEAVLRMGVTTEAPCYDKELIKKGLMPLLELTEMIYTKRENEHV